MKIHPGTSRLFEIFDTIAHTAPKQFWKFPTALTLARAPGLLFRFLFRSPHDFQKI